MAPVHPRQFHSLAHPGAAKGPPATPVLVTTFISLKTFFQLFAGTFVIFFAGVFFWKIGRFLRFITRNRVLGEGKTTTTRYARTWYGWVPLTRHEANKEVFRRCFGRIREWTAWKSSRANYRWIWWDPGQKELEKYNRSKRPLRWLPTFLRSYECTPADVIWNSGPPRGYRFTTFEEKDSMNATGTSSLRNGRPLMSGGLQSLSRRSKPKSRRSGHELFRSDESSAIPAVKQDSYDYSSVRRRKLPVRDSKPDQSNIFLYRGSQTSSYRGKYTSLPRLTRKRPRLSRAVSLPCLVNGRQRQGGYRVLSDSSWENENSGDYENPATVSKSHLSLKYRAWSTRMQVQTCKLVRRRPHQSQGPPGSPITELLASFSSEENTSVKIFRGLKRGIIGTFSFEPNNHISVRLKRGYSRQRTAESDDQCSLIDSPLGQDYSPSMAKTFPLRKPRLRAFRDIEHLISSLENRDIKDLQRARATLNQQITNHAESWSTLRGSTPCGGLSDWEVQLMHSLDRKLEWLLNEVDPGRKPFHFPTLANHWLNRKCWVVTDPSSRINHDSKREWGDPRFNVPYPEPTYAPRPKYSMRVRRRARTPRIDSWRVAVNRQRKEAGLNDVIRAVELFDSSADEPPDGKVDPACWILRKPPQGFGMSTKQKNAFYEGGAGWQEKLGDWQKVDCRYRIHKAVHEGKVNRNRAKEIAAGITKYYRVASAKISRKQPFPEE